MRVLISYLSFSGNTEEVAEILRDSLVRRGHIVDTHKIDFEFPVPEMNSYDLNLVGSFTWGKGSTPFEMKDFILDVGYKPRNVAVFGTGDTQFGGDDMFCGAVDRLTNFYESNWRGLKIEQSPRGSQESKVLNWLDNILSEVEGKRMVG